MKQGWFEVKSQRTLSKDVYELCLLGDNSAFVRPGQFANVKVGNAYLRRPLSIADCAGEVLTLIYKTIGEGTAWLAKRQAGERLDLLTGLGNGFHTEDSGDSPLLIGGGLGLPPMYYLAKTLLREGKKPRLVMGFASREDVFYQEEFERLLPTQVTTVDGSLGIKGLVTDVPLLKQDTSVLACGPVPMLKALMALPLPGQLSLEERMGCGFGACMGCSIMTQKGSKRVCVEGPVFYKEDLLW